MASFDENGKYIKTNWKAGDKITATKLNKIEESIEAVNDNDISRHVEADARLDALEAKDVAHDKEFTNVKNLIADNKAAAELGDYEINSRMQFLEYELEEAVAEVNNVASTVDGKINAAVTNVNNVATTVDGKIDTAQANMTAQVNQGKADMEAMVAEVDTEMTELQNDVLEIQNNINDITNAIRYLPSIYQNGYYVLPGGLTLQWGSTSMSFQNSSSAMTYVNFPILYTSWIQTFVNVTALNSENGSSVIVSSRGYEDGISISAQHYKDLVLSNENSVTVSWLAIGI